MGGGRCNSRIKIWAAQVSGCQRRAALAEEGAKGNMLCTIDGKRPIFVLSLALAFEDGTLLVKLLDTKDGCDDVHGLELCVMMGLKDGNGMGKPLGTWDNTVHWGGGGLGGWHRGCVQTGFKSISLGDGTLLGLPLVTKDCTPRRE